MKNTIATLVLFFSSITYADQLFFDVDSFSDLNTRAQIILSEMQDKNIKAEDYLQGKIKDSTLKVEITNLRKDIRNFVISSSMEIPTLAHEWDKFSGTVVANSFMSQLFLENFLLEFVDAKNVFNTALKEEDHDNVLNQTVVSNWFRVYEYEHPLFKDPTNKGTSRQLKSLYLIRYMLVMNLMTSKYMFLKQFNFSVKWTYEYKNIIANRLDVLAGSTLQDQFKTLICVYEISPGSHQGEGGDHDTKLDAERIRKLSEIIQNK